MRRELRELIGGGTTKRMLPLDLEGGALVAGACSVYAAIVGWVRGVSPDILSLKALVFLGLAFGIAGFVVGSVVLGRPDFGPSKRWAAVRGIIAVIPVYATGGLLFLPAERWFALIPVLSVAAAGLVGPPIGVFMYRTFRRRDSKNAPLDSSVELAWLKGEMLGSWTPLLFTIAILATLGVGLRAIPEEVTTPDEPTPPTLGEIYQSLPALRDAVEADQESHEAMFDLGSALLKIGRFDEAVDQLQNALLRDSSSVETWIALGRAAFYAGRPALSARAYWNVLRLEPAALSSTGLDRVLLDAALSGELPTDSAPSG